MPFWSSSSSSKNTKDHVEGQSSNDPKLEKKLKALIVDDNPVIRMILTRQLTNIGVESQEAENGKEAIDLYLAGAVFDIILMDKDTPEMDGPQATRLLRSMEVHAKIVGMSADERIKDVEEFMNAGLDDFYVKPITLSMLVSIIQKYHGN